MAPGEGMHGMVSAQAMVARRELECGQPKGRILGAARAMGRKHDAARRHVEHLQRQHWHGDVGAGERMAALVEGQIDGRNGR